MKLTDEQKEDLKAGRDMGVGDQNNYAVVKGKNLRWPGAVIPYEIDCSLGKRHNLFYFSILFYSY